TSSTSTSGLMRSASLTTDAPSPTAATTSNSCASTRTGSSIIVLWSSATSTRRRFTTRSSVDSSAAAPSRHDPLLDRELNQLGARPQPQLLHHPVFVKGDGARSDVQDAADFLHRSAFGEQLQDLSLA